MSWCPILRLITPLTLVLTLASAEPVRAQDFVGKPVTLDLSANGAVLTSRLPFDVPFLFTGAAEGIELILYRRTAASRQPITSCSVTPVPTTETTLYVSPPPALTTEQSAPPDRLQNYDRWHCPAANCKDFQLRVQKLEASRFYCFHFLVVRHLPATDTSRMLVHDAIDRWTRERLGPAIATPDAKTLDALRRDVLVTLRDAAAANNLAVLTNSIMGDETRFYNAFIETVRGVLSAQREVDGIDGRLEMTARSLLGDIEGVPPQVGWLASPFFVGSAPRQGLLDRLDMKKTDATVAPYASIVAKLRALGGANLLFELQGLAPSSSGGSNLKGQRTSADRAAARKRLGDNVITPFEDTLRLLTVLQTDQDLRKALDVTDSELPLARAAAARIASELAQLRLVSYDIEASEAALGRREKAIDDLTARVTLAQGVGTLGSTVGDFSTRKMWYIAMDLGLAVAPRLDSVFPYAGMNVYLSPVNKDAPVSTVGFRKRFAFLLGVSYAIGTDKLVLPNTETVLDDRTVVVGGGYRVLDSLRLTAGGVVLRERDRNPLLTDKRLVLSPFVGLSIDWNIKGSFLDKLFGTEETTKVGQ